AVRAVAFALAGLYRRRLPARLADPPSPSPRALAGRAPERLPGRTGRALARPGLADRAIFRAALAGPHGAAPAAHDGGAALALARRSLLPPPPRPARASADLLDRAAAALASPPRPSATANPSGGRLDSVRRRDLAVARTGNLRTRAPLQWLAL